MGQTGIGSRIRQARIASGLKPADLAQAVGLSTSAINHWELGRQRVAPEMLSLLAPLLGVGADYLATGVRDGEPSLSTGACLLKILSEAQERLSAAAGLAPGRVELVLTFRQSGMP